MDRIEAAVSGFKFPKKHCDLETLALRPEILENRDTPRINRGSFSFTEQEHIICKYKMIQSQFFSSPVMTKIRRINTLTDTSCENLMAITNK